jgi:hypothetical protein
MKIRIILSLSMVFILITGGVLASTIVLKDGRTIVGNIVEQDKTKVVVKVDNVSLTYYKDGIASINEEAGKDTAIDAEKEKLIEQFLNYSQTGEIVSDWVKAYTRPNARQVVLSAEEKYIPQLTKMRKQILAQSLSTADLKAVLDFFSSAAGKEYLKDIRRYRNFMAMEFFPTLGKISKWASQLPDRTAKTAK